MNAVLLIGSGSDASVVSKWTLEEYDIVCAINHAWKLPRRLDYHIFAGDYHKYGDFPGRDFPDHRRIGKYLHNNHETYRRYGGAEVGIGVTSFFNAAYWVLGSTGAGSIDFIGCSMYYPERRANTFYGGGNPDPIIRTSEDRLHTFFVRFKEQASSQGVTLANRGTKEGLMPY